MSAEQTFYVNGEWLPPARASVPVLDRGFLFGDGVYEVIPVYQGRPFRFEQHLHRLQDSLDATGIANPHDPAGWARLLDEAVQRNGGGDRSIYLQVTRGVAPRRKHPFPMDITPTVVIMSPPLELPAADVRDSGVAAITRPDPRWRHCNIKSTALLANVMLSQEACAAEAVEAILIRDGELTEGAASNVFVVHDGVVATPPHGHCLLPGVTRDLIVELAPQAGITLEERSVAEKELATADEIWISSSTRELLAVTRRDGETVGNGRVGDVWRTMYDAFQARKQEWLRGAA